ncbi:MAG: pitrilysin family protein [Dehalococcoidia bacterium]
MRTIHTLDNGLRVVVTPMAHASSVSVSVYVGAGSRYEDAPEARLSHFVEHLAFKGTAQRPRPQDISIEIDSIGGTMNAATDREYTVYYTKVTREFAERAVVIIADMLRNSLFVGGEIERERGVILEELAAVEDSPDEQAGLLLDALLWPGQALGRDIAGTPESVGAISHERLIAYYRRQYVPNACVISIAGAIEEDLGLDLVRASFGSWEPGRPLDWQRAAEDPHGARSGTIAKPTEQAHLSLGVRALSLAHPDRYASDVLSVILGEGMSSRLFMRLREELGLCYDIHSFASHLRDTGLFGVYAGVDPPRAAEAVREIAGELARVREPVTAEELERAKALVRSRVLLRMEDSRAVSGWYGSQVILDQPRQTPAEAIALTDAVTAEDVQRVATSLLTDNALQLAVVGPFEGVDLFDGISVGA